MSNDNEYTIRWANPTEWKPAMVMVWRTFMKFEARDYTQEGVENFYEFITDAKLYNSFLRGSYQMMIAFHGNRIIGIGTLRNINHLSLLFVDEEYQGKGVGRRIMQKLCDYLKTEMGESSITLDSAPYAVEFYKKIGFEITAPERTITGIRITSMEKHF